MTNIDIYTFYININIMTSVLEHVTFDVTDYLDYNYTVRETDFAISYIKTPDGNVMLGQNEIENPLFVGESGGSLLKLSPKEIYGNFSRVFVVCMRDNYEESDDLYYNSYSRVINKSTAPNFADNYVFLKTSMKILDEQYYKRCANVVTREILSTLYGIDRESVENEEIVVPMFELTESMARMNLVMYDVQYGLEDVSKFLSLKKFYNKENNRNVSKYLAEHLGNLRESQFWSNPRNCIINGTQKFQRRGFVTRDKKQKHAIKQLANETKEEKKEIVSHDKLFNSLVKNNSKQDSTYVSLDDETTIDPYIDLHTVLKTSEKRTFYMQEIEKLEMTKEQITELFLDLTTEEEMYNLFNTLAVSKEYCHTVVNNKEILIKMKPLFEKYAPVYKLIFGYAWLTFVLEEYIMKSKSTIDHRFVFDIDTAHHLPTFPYIFDDVHQNPYIVAPFDQKVLNASKNAMSLFCIDDFDGYGVCTSETFKTRINLMTTGNSKQNIFDGLDWQSFAITGSSIPACLQKKSPLFLNVEQKDSSNDENTLKFFNSYYSKSDIDLVCNEQTIYGFSEKVLDAITKIKANINCGSDGLSIEPIKSLYVCLSKHFFSEKLDEINDILGTDYTVDQLIENCDTPEFKEYLYPTYVTNKQKSNAKIRKSGKKINDYMQAFMNYSGAQDIKIDIIKENYTEHSFDSDISLHLNDFRSESNKVKDEDNFLLIKICEGVKFKITSSKLRKPIELFRCKSNDFFGVVGKFHLPCVRGYNKGDSTVLMPTCISAMMTGINLDYRYFVGVKNQFDISGKYETRGFGIFLSPQELEDLIDHRINNKNSPSVYSIKSRSPEDLAKVLGGKELTHPIYKPLEFENGLTGVYNNPSVKYIKTIDDLREFYKKKCGYSAEKCGIDMMKFTTYSPDGDINPYMNSISTIYYDLMNANKQQKYVQNRQTKSKVNKSYKSNKFNKVVVEKIGKK